MEQVSSKSSKHSYNPEKTAIIEHIMTSLLLKTTRPCLKISFANITKGRKSLPLKINLA